eukprot:COSAG01_NODE_2852_length_6950_cov_12.447518_1_plen_117_part_00
MSGMHLQVWVRDLLVSSVASSFLDLAERIRLVGRIFFESLVTLVFVPGVSRRSLGMQLCTYSSRENLSFSLTCLVCPLLQGHRHGLATLPLPTHSVGCALGLALDLVAVGLTNAAA